MSYRSAFRFLVWVCLTTLGVNTYSVVFMDVDSIGAYLNKDGTSSQRIYTGTFDIAQGDGPTSVTLGTPYASPSQTLSDIAGYNRTDFTISSATAYFYIRDDASDSGTEEVRIQFVRNDAYNGSGGDYEFARGQIANKSFSIFGGSVNSTVVASLVDGVIQYTVEADRDDFILDYARLTVVATANSSGPAGSDLTSVPEPTWTVGVATMALLGFVATRKGKRPSASTPTR